MKIRDLALSAGMDFEPSEHGYPHFYYLDDKATSGVFDLKGTRVRQFLDYSVGTDLTALKPGSSAPTCVHTPDETVEGMLTCVSADEYRLSVPAEKAALAATWLRDLSDGYILFDESVERIMPGPVVVAESDAKPVERTEGDCCNKEKPYFLSMCEGEGEALPSFEWTEPADPPLRRTPLYQVHKDLGAKVIPFAGWEMPVWYTSVVEEHLATRQAAGLFDVAHMGVYSVEGADAASFLDTICGNDCGGLAPGESLYSQFLTPDAEVIDDTLIYRRAYDKYLVVVNASNDDKDRTWFEAVRDGKVKIDNNRPWARTYGYEAVIRNLRDPKAGDDMRVDIALQGPKSRDTLLAMGVDDATRARIMKLKRTELCDAVVGGFDLIVSRTGYTGEKMAFELFVHPERAADFWNAVLKAGEQFGVKPIGLGARDSLRTEAGLPLYGHEMGLGSGQDGPARPGRGGRRLRLLRQTLQTLLHRARGFHRQREDPQGRGGALPLHREGRAHGPQRRPGGGQARQGDRLGDLLRRGCRRLPDRPGLPGFQERRSGYAHLGLPVGAGEDRPRAGRDESRR